MYPRQSFAPVPLALRIPIDTDRFEFAGETSKLTLRPLAIEDVLGLGVLKLSSQQCLNILPTLRQIQKRQHRRWAERCRKRFCVSRALMPYRRGSAFFDTNQNLRHYFFSSVKKRGIAKMIERYLFKQVKSDLKEKMVFIGGPRQVGKTYLSKEIGRAFEGGCAYLNWDDDDDRRAIFAKEFPKTGLLILDELHKNRKWRQLLKGLYDKNKDMMRILVTGSARLDYYRFGGDSLQGRYHYLRLHPLSVKELGLTTQDDLVTLLKLGGFPEPYFSGSETKARRWSRTYRQRLVREDLAALEKTEDLARIELMTMRLPDLVASPLSINALREDLDVSHVTAAKWFQILERLYHVFRVTPFGSPRIKSVKKEFKHYHYDWSLVPDTGARFENFIGSHLLKWCHFVEDTEGFDMDLRYFRDREQREVDFVILQDQKPLLFCEVKTNDKTFSSHLRYLKSKFPHVRAVQITLNPTPPIITGDGLELLSAMDFLKDLPV